MISLLCGLSISYLIGSLPTAFIVGKFVRNIDIRTVGSGNVGATNVFRAVGKKWGVFVLLIDMVKGILPVVGLPIFLQPDIVPIDMYKVFLGVAVVCGHNWTVFLKFKGGKGVASTAGILIALFPNAILVVLLLFFVVVFVTRYVSLGSIIGAVCFPFVLAIFYRHSESFYFSLCFSVLLSFFILFRHKTNIMRLIKGEENKISFSKK